MIVEINKTIEKSSEKITSFYWTECNILFKSKHTQKRGEGMKNVEEEKFH